MRAAAFALLLAAVLAAAAPASAGTLTAGAGRADVTPPTGYYGMGYVRSDMVLRGQHTRLFARALVLERDGRKLALVAADLGAIAGGMVTEAAERLRDRGFHEGNVLVSASHTHAGPTGYFPFSTYNTVFMTMRTPLDQNVAGARDPQLYAFMVRRLTEAIRRADDDRAPARAGWAAAKLTDVTRNRSVEAHLHDHGIVRAFGEGSPAEDPLGALHTIDPDVHVLRVDKVRGRRRIPIGVWTTFANHGTVNPHTFAVYNADHHGSATRVVEDAIRKAGRVPRGQEVVNAYGNTDEGDMSSALDRRGPAWADEVGRREAETMLGAWRAAGRAMTAEPALDSRWTRVCFCGQQTEGGPVDDEAVVGLPLFTGSEEGRGPLYDETGVPFEDRRSPVPDPHQGYKVQVARQGEGSVPKAVPLLAIRVGDRVIGSIPGEMTVGMGERVRAAMLDAAGGAGVRQAILSGLANEFLQYFVTPEEYDRQHYEGGSQLYGRVAANLLKVELAALTRRLVAGEPAPPPYPADPRNGVPADAPPFALGAADGTVVEQPRPRVARLERAAFAWTGGPRGTDRPLDRAFVTVDRYARGRWRPLADDLGLQILWHAGEGGDYRAEWDVPLDAPAGAYRMRVTANRYELESEPFRVVPATTLAAVVEDGRVRLLYPPGDLTFRPRGARRLAATFVAGAERRIRRSGFDSLAIPRGARRIPPGGARDGYGNRSDRELVLR
ncbi:MAG TPA: neutral/alkaline non-lysosomal ceramidase N-terminal domain-containing protein [Solirubrobacteraceae bacterium]|jgi:neutral ceramidase|nr:neutral/alkaline non-lysosomal ceramidase N-terminal domain-containing protein [Solirubrobacteraceae bacterium]